MADSVDPTTGTELSPLERAIDAVLFWPFDLGARAADHLPDVTARVRDQLLFARFIGRLAVQQGNVEIRRRIESATRPDPSPAAADPVADLPTEPTTGIPTSGADAVDAGGLALPDYDQLPAAHIIDKLAGLTRQERDLIESYEAATRGRRTVLGKLERLREE